MNGLRAYDVLMAAERCLSPGYNLQKLQDSARGLPIFLVDDAHLCFFHTVDAKGAVRNDEQPPAVIPFERFWLEWQPLGPDNRPPELPPEMSFIRIGVICDYLPTARALTAQILTSVITRGSCAVIPSVVVFLPFDEQGFCERPGILVPEAVNEQARTIHGGPVKAEDVDGEIGTILFSLGMLGVKNVDRRSAQLPRALRRHPGEFAGTASDVHHVLDIPGASELREYVQGPGDAVEKRLHIVRGHFADYTEGGGLFGKLHGKYYIAPHVRGSAARGFVTKDYRVLGQ